MHDPRVPESLEGWSILHQMFRIRWDAWRALEPAERARRAAETSEALVSMDRGEEGTTACCTLLGHKGDLMLIHFRRGFEALQQAQLAVAHTPLQPFLEPTSSYVSIVELGMYEMTSLLHGRIAERGLKPGTPEYATAFDAEMEEQRKRVANRLWLQVPARRYIGFYPMNKRRGEGHNWYAETFEHRARMMRDHGMVGRNYAGEVTQIISGSIGYDDWEWGVDLFVDDPVVLKKLLYDMRFDEASTWYAEFGPFYTGLQFSASELPRLLDGALPAFVGKRSE